MTEEKHITELIVDSFFKRFKNFLICDVIVVGGGPSGLVCSYFLAKNGIKTILIERKASIGGGTWGGGMMFNTIVFEKSAEKLLDEFTIQYERKNNKYLIAKAPEVVSAITVAVCRSGAEIFNFMSAEDIMVASGRVCGLVLNWTLVGTAGFPVDPLTIGARYVVDATGHDCAVCKMVVEKHGKTFSGKKKFSFGEKPMNVTLGEQEVVRNSKEIFPGVYVAGMAANAVFGGHRMGPIFGGMVLSGEKVARLIIKQLKRRKR